MNVYQIRGMKSILYLDVNNIHLYCLGFFIPLENFSLVWRRHHYLWKAANFDLCSALMATEQWEFLSVPNLLWHGWPMTLTPIAERCSGAVTNCFYDLGLSRLLFEHPTFRLRGERSNPLCHRRNYIFIYNMTRFWNVNPYAFSQACLYTVSRWNILGNVCPT